MDALGRAHYKRYDERTSTMLGQAAELPDHRWGGDLRKLRDEADGVDDRISKDARAGGCAPAPAGGSGHPAWHGEGGQ